MTGMIIKVYLWRVTLKTSVLASIRPSCQVSDLLVLVLVLYDNSPIHHKANIDRSGTFLLHRNMDMSLAVETCKHSTNSWNPVCALQQPSRATKYISLPAFVLVTHRGTLTHRSCAKWCCCRTLLVNTRSWWASRWWSAAHCLPAPVTVKWIKYLSPVWQLYLWK